MTPCHNFLSDGEGCWQVVCETCFVTVYLQLGAVMDGQNWDVVLRLLLSCSKNCFGGSDHVLRTYHNLLNEGAIVILVTFSKEQCWSSQLPLSLLEGETAGNCYSKDDSTETCNSQTMMSLLLIYNCSLWLQCIFYILWTVTYHSKPSSSKF